ncbi:aminoacyl-tRNA hydrolase [Corynebacterium terpenotabidum]|uniref:peptidyl-tRNA hydrolase n=1 Tax=Corynebacterium terpenotabidum Y-11 TaxID=1200352 RepID=S4XCP9_9CORY|nr:aminoacyl-tRNA hydrolase [Corynebacterium terpenotabidum]AGP30294.1 hypothetical protein A606_03205 [Corynebacterium terpenotabidum Y-11]
MTGADAASHSDTGDTGDTTPLIRAAHRRLSTAMAADRDGEDPTDPTTVQAMPLVLEIPHAPLPERRELLEAAAVACVAVCLDPRAGQPESAFAASLGRWYGARIRKIARRARNKRWVDAQAVPGVTATVGNAHARAFTPCPVNETPALLNRLQIEGTDLPGTPEQEAVLAADRHPVIWVDAGLGMSVGKAAAQVSHGSMLLAAAMDVEDALDWAATGFPLHVCEVESARFAEACAEAEQIRDGVGGDLVAGRAAAVVQDAGYTEVAPGSVTVVAVTR